jgi:LysR family transcriptional regulator, glycine cleavage system transcriptional activator
MQAGRVQIPPFRALLAFRAAATHDRLSDAAASLGVTESAISHQLRQLETLLHVKLFGRERGRLVLTETGRRYLDRIEPALREIQAATAAIQPADGRKVVRLTLPPSLAATWLIPRLGRFEAEHPDIDVQLVLTTRIIDMARDQVDLAVRYGRGAWSGVETVYLFDDLATPVASPGYQVPEPAPGRLPSGIRYILNRSIPGEWEEWARARGLDSPPLDGALALDSIEQALQVAEAGHGLAMGRSPYIEGRLERGTLVAPFGAAGPTGAAYYLCRPAGTAPTAVARRVARWVEEQAEAFTADRPPHGSGPGDDLR